MKHSKFLLPESQVIALNCGLRVSLKSPGFSLWLRQAIVPSRLATSVKSGMSVAEVEAEVRSAAERDPEEAYQQLLAFNKAVLIECVEWIELDDGQRYRFAKHPVAGRNEISPSRLKPEIVVEIIAWFNTQVKSIERGGGADLETFPEPAKPADGADAGPSGSFLARPAL